MQMIRNRLKNIGLMLAFILVLSCATSQKSAPFDGYVSLLVDVMPDGSTENVRVLKADPPGIFEEEAIKAIKKWKYTRSGKGPQPIVKDHIIRVEFRAQDK